MSIVEEQHASRDDAAASVADRAVARLSAALTGDSSATATLVVSGGNTPAPVFRALSGVALDWQRITVLLSDERWVPPSDEASNEKLLRDTLLRERATAARLLSIRGAGSSPEAACESLERDWQALARPVAFTLLGMGTDGHFASLFPDDHTNESALDPAGREHFVAVRTEASPHPRVSMTLSALLDSREIVLLIFGEEKRRVYESARAGDRSLPVCALLENALLEREDAPLGVVWAP